MKKPIFLLLAIISFFASHVFSQVISPAGNSSVPGISKERLGKLDAMLDEAIQ